MLPWALYNLTPRDQGSPNLRPYFQSVDSSFAGLSKTMDAKPIPDDNMLLVTAININTEVSAGGNAIIHHMQLIETSPSLTVKIIMSNENPSSTPSFRWSTTWIGAPIMIQQPGTFMRFLTSLSAPAVAASFTAAISGVLIPKGTLALS